MEGFMVSAATGALKAVTVKLATLLGNEFKNMKDVRKEIEPLCDELKYMHAFLEKMSEEENPSNQDKIWMTDVREMSYDIEDSLDEFMICINDEKSAKKDGLIKKFKKLLDKMKAHQRISKVIQDFKTQIKEVGDRNHRYRTVVTSTKDSHERIDIRAQAIFKDASELVGIDEQKNELINLLTDDGSSSQHQVKVVAILRLGGLGKTTLANQVYESLKDKFDCHALVTVSRTPHMIDVLRTILSDSSRQQYANTEAGDVQHLIRKIIDFLQDKRYLIVVDDLWESESWETLQNAFIKNSYGSRIITTTRKTEVAEFCCSSHRGHIYKLRPLNPKNSRKLFLKRIFGLEERCPTYLTVACDEILKKCDGLPLAIISIAGLLAGKAPTVDEWNKVQHSFGHALERHSNVNRTIQILSVSYFDLPLNLRSCLLYLSIFPEDYEIEKVPLILRWIAEGFIHEEHGFTQYELGERCFNEHINRSLIQPVHSKFSGVFFCRVHDTILEFIVSKAVDENFVALIGVPNIRLDLHKKIRRLSLHDRNEVSDALVALLDKRTYYHARALSLFAKSLDILPSLLKFRHVRVLDLEDCRGLQAHHLAHIDSLFSLRYLSLCDTGIDNLPEEIGELQYLQTLDVRQTYIQDLPSSVGLLARLVTLLCDFDVRLPDGFGKNMQALQRLGCIGVSIQSPSFAQELRQLRNLNMLEVMLNHEVSKDLASSLCTFAMGCLNSLTIEGSIQQSKMMMEPWSPTPLCLKILQIRWIRFAKVPRWISSLDNLEDLSLHVEQLGVEDFVLLGSLNALSSLDLRSLQKIADRSSSSSSQGTQRIKINSSHGFSSLRRFQVSSQYCALVLLFEVGAMPKLQELNLIFDGDKTGSLTNGEFDFGIHHLPCLGIIRCSFGYFAEARSREGYEPEHPAWDALKKAVSANPNHPMLCYTPDWFP